MNARVRTTAPARRLGDEWIWVGFRSALRNCFPAEHAALELERLHVDELARLLLQAAEFQLRGAHGVRPRADGLADRWDARALEIEARRSALEFEAWRSALYEQLAALHADGASLSPRLATLVAACLAAAAHGGDGGAQTFERAECLAPTSAAADSVRAAPKQREGRFAASAGALEGRAQGRSDRASPRSPGAFSAHADSVAATSAATVTSMSTSTVTCAPATVAPSDAASDVECDVAGGAAREAVLVVGRDAAGRDAAGRDAAGRDAAGRRSPAESERWPAARDLAQAARVLAPSARSHCALGRAQLAAGDAAAARGCFRAALASTADVRLQREAQLALDELSRTPRLSSAVGAEALGVSHVDVPHF